MTEGSTLKVLQEFIKTNTSDMKLEKKRKKDESELVPPAVFIAWMPPKNHLSDGYDIPGVLVGMDDGEDDGEEATVNIRITFIVYDPGEPVNNVYTPDMKGYTDLLHLMTKVRLAISQERFIKGIEVYISKENPIKWGMYTEENTWPYFFGWMSFTCRISSQDMQSSSINNYLRGEEFIAHQEISAQAITPE